MVQARVVATRWRASHCQPQSGWQSRPRCQPRARVAPMTVQQAEAVSTSTRGLMKLPVVLVSGNSGNSWAIRGIYEHQAIRVGLRQLDEAWGGAGLLEFAQGRGGITRANLFRSLLTGALNLQSIPDNDVSAIQMDLTRLSLMQQLRLRVLLLEYQPRSGSKEAFVEKLDALLFENLGRQAVGGLEFSPELKPAAFSIMGREAVLMAAAAHALGTGVCFCWWPAGTRRVFFNPKHFASSTSFPSEGVIEFSSCPRPDAGDTTRTIMWMDWQLKLLTSECSLRRQPQCHVPIANFSLDTIRAGRQQLKPVSTDCVPPAPKNTPAAWQVKYYKC